jgi:hypothetical protein
MAKIDLLSRGTVICDPSDFSALQNKSGVGNEALAIEGFPAGPTKAIYVEKKSGSDTYGQVQLDPYLSLGIAAADFKGLLIEAYNPGSNPRGFYIEIYNSAGTRIHKSTLVADVSSGWQLCFIPKSNWAVNAFAVDTAIRFFRIGIEGTDNSGWPMADGESLFFGRCYVDPVQLPVFLLGTDDGVAANIEHGDGYPTGYPASGGNYKTICDYYKFRASAYIVPPWVGTSGYLTWDQLLALRDAGWTICSHSTTHPTGPDNAGLRMLGPYGITQSYSGAAEDDSAIYADIMTAVDELHSRGFRDALHFALPQGGWDTYVRTACLRAGLKSVRAISSPTTGFPVRGALHVGGGNYQAQRQSGWFELAGAIQIDGTPTLAQIEAYVDEVIRVGATGSCYTHGIDAATAVKFDGLCAYLKTKQDAGLIRVMTVADYYEKNVDWGGWAAFDGTMPALTLSPTAPGKLKQVQEWKKVASAKEIGKY